MALRRPTSSRSRCPGFAATVDALPAERLYAGEQHRRLMAGVDALRVQRRGRGVGDLGQGRTDRRQTSELAPYDETFAGIAGRGSSVRSADRLGIADGPPSSSSREPCTLTIVLVGNDYFDAARLDEPVDWALADARAREPESGGSNCRPTPTCGPSSIGQTLAREWSLPLTLLKGEIVRRMLFDLARGSSTVDVRSLSTDSLLQRLLNDQTLPTVAC